MLYCTIRIVAGWNSFPIRDLDDEGGPKLLELLAGSGVRKTVSGSFGRRIKPLLDSKKIQMIVPDNPGITVKKIAGLISGRS